ncbi:MAG: phosphatidylserine decarboxylase family protein [Desulfobacteraceae bacterium]|nr:phosphatidylserine decarboxylase family protein [Desulfobacteraceae bacterium]MCF8095847.1 phosphatidylserine decarboxylase family protein [Desulfobacteraceae bacterium]
MNRFFRADPQSRSAFAIAEPGYPFIAAAGFATLVFALVGIAGLAIAGLAVTFFICWFFRDPDRVTPEETVAVIAAADGKVVSVRTLEKNPYTEGPCLQIGVFMNIFNVHVNRVPCTGSIKKIRYVPGSFMSADREAASTKNEHNAVTIETKTGHTVAVVQIAGLVARRIICNIAEGQEVTAGQRFGMICFGSRVDLYLPEDTQPAVSAGQRVRAGTSIVGYLPDR